MDLRVRILAFYDAGEGTRQDIADRYKVSLGVVKKLLSRRKQTGDISCWYTHCGRKPYFTEAFRKKIRKPLSKQPDLTLEQIREALNLECSLPAIHYVLKDMNLSLKKTLHASEQEREDVVKARAEWVAAQDLLDPHRLVFIDEAGAKTNMIRLYGRAEKGKRIVDFAPHGYWCTTTMICSVRLDGSIACMAVDGPTTGDVFRAFVKYVLVPSLRPGDIVILDNLASQKNQAALELIELAGAEARFLPPYSPDLDPIEKIWSKVKQILRSMKARTQETLIATIACALECVTQEDARGWFTSCGYTSC